MATNDRDQHERAPHPDGRYENIINDSIATGSSQIGVRVDMNVANVNQPKNPYHLKPKKDKEMERFSKFFDGK